MVMMMMVMVMMMLMLMPMPMMMMMMTSMTTYGCLGSFTFWGRVGRKARRCGKCCLQKGCNLVVRRFCCGLAALPRATWMPSWLQDWLGRAKLSPRWPQDGPKRLPKIILQDFLVDCRAFLGRARAARAARARWRQLWPALLGPFWWVREGIWRQVLGLEGLSWGCKVAKG